MATYTPSISSQATYDYINAQGGNLVKYGSGVLVAIIIGTKDALGTGSISVYDGINTSGAPIMVLSSGILASPTVIDVGPGIAFGTGLYVQVAGGLTAPNVTVVFM